MQWWPPQRATRPAAVTGTAAWVGWAAWVVWAAWECKDRAYDKTEDLQSMQCLPFFLDGATTSSPGAVRHPLRREGQQVHDGGQGIAIHQDIDTPTRVADAALRLLALGRV